MSNNTQALAAANEQPGYIHPLDRAVSLYLRYVGEQVSADDLWIGLPRSEGVEMDGPLLARALERVGYVAAPSPGRKLASLPTPCILRLKSDRFVLATEITATEISVVDGPARNSVKTIPLAKIAQEYAGEYLELFPSMGELERRYSTQSEARHWFWGKLFQPRSRFFEVVLASLVANIIAVTVSLFALQVYDRVIPNENEATLWVLAIGCAIAILFEFFLRTSRAKLIDDTGRTAEIEMTRELFQKLVGMRIDKLPAGPGSLAHMVREFQGVREFFNTATVGVLADLPFVVIFLTIIYTIAGPVVWIILTGATLMVLPSLFFQKKMARLSRETQGGLSSASRVLTEAAYGLESVKTSNAEARLAKSWEDIIHLNAAKSSEQRDLSSKLTFWAGSVQQWTYISSIIAGVYLLFAGEFTTGSIIAISILTSRTLSPISQLSGVLTRWQNMRASLTAMDTIINSEQERSPDRVYVRRARLRGKLALSDVQAIYAGQQHPTIHVKQLDVAPGERLALLGSNGSGKSTLLRVLSGLHYPSEGEYLVDDLDIRQIDPTDVRTNIGYLPQETRLFSGTLRDNIRIRGLQFSDDAFFEALSFAGLAEMVRAHPEGLDLPIHDGGSGLSTGQKLAVGLARLYLLDPSIVILDEPTAALDQENEAAFVEKFDEWLGDRTCIVATHRLPILKKMTHVAVMQGGRLRIHGPRDAVLEKLRG